MNFETFKTNFEKNPAWRDLLPECAEFLIRPEVQHKRTWKRFTDSFSKVYLTVLFERWGYKPSIVNISRVKITDPICFMAVVSALYHSGIIQATTGELAENILLSTDTGYKLGTLKRRVSDGWQEYDEILDVINKRKKRVLGK